MRNNIIKRLEKLRELKENWDSYGALAPKDETIDRAIVFALEIITGNPHICLSVNGHVVFEGNNGTSVEVGSVSAADSLWIDETEET